MISGEAHLEKLYTGKGLGETHSVSEPWLSLFQSTNTEAQVNYGVLSRLETEALKEGLQFISFREATSKMTNEDCLRRSHEFEFSILWARELRKRIKSLTLIQQLFWAAPKTIPFEPEGITVIVSRLKQQVKYSKWIRKSGILFGVAFSFIFLLNSL